MLFLAIDPGSVKLGAAVFQDSRLLYYAFYDFEKTAYERRPTQIWDTLEALAREYRLEEVAVEAATRRTSDSGMLTKIPELEVACTIIRRWARSLKLEYRQYNASSWRKGFAGDGHAPKDAVARVVYLIWPKLPANLPDHVTDAIGIGCYHYQLRKYLELASGNGV